MFSLTRNVRMIHAQWVPSRCSIEDNEVANRVAGGTASSRSSRTPRPPDDHLDGGEGRPRRNGLARGLFPVNDGRPTSPVMACLDWDSAVDVHQLSAGHWSGSRPIFTGSVACHLRGTRGDAMRAV